MKLAVGKKSESGNSMVEFAIVAPFWIAVFFGTVALGTNLTRTIQVVQTSRDLGHMYAEGTDFSAVSSQNLITGGSGSASMVQGMDLTAGTGNAVVIFSQVRHIDPTDADCASTCANKGNDVFMNRIVIGNSTVKTSVLGNPDAADLNGQGNTKTPATDATDKTNQYNLFAPTTYVLPKAGGIAYVVEVYVSSPDLSFLGYAGAGNYARAVF